jgi:peptidoglycan/xylan/chitin deacetylase (PgdA/CDA1 family)
MGASSSFLPIMSLAARTIRAIPGGKALVDGGALVFAGHRVSSIDPRGIPANERLKITPEYLDYFVRRVRALGYSFVSLDDLASTVHAGGETRGLAALTFDDGYQDNLERALPVLEKLEAPFTVYVLCRGKNQGTFLWWFALETYLKSRESVRFSDGTEVRCPTARGRDRLFMDIRRRLLQNGGMDARSFLRGLLPDVESAFSAGTADQHIMGDSDVMLLSRSTLATIGSHTMSHSNLAALSEAEVRTELLESRQCLEAVIGREVRHVAFPFGGRAEAGRREYRLASQAGFTTAATMIAGSVARRDPGCLLRLPRIPLREGADPRDLIAENRARLWASRAKRLMTA